MSDNQRSGATTISDFGTGHPHERITGVTNYKAQSCAEQLTLRYAKPTYVNPCSDYYPFSFLHSVPSTISLYLNPNPCAAGTVLVVTVDPGRNLPLHRTSHAIHISLIQPTLFYIFLRFVGLQMSAGTDTYLATNYHQPS